MIFAICALPLLTLAGMAIDYGFWCGSYATLALAADSAALNAVRVAVNGEALNDPNYIAEGTTAGTSWFNAMAGTTIGHAVPTIALSGTTTITARVQFSGSIPSLLGGLIMRRASYQIFGQSAAVATLAPYLNIDIILDNSSSMEIGATPIDIFIMQEITPCAASGAYAGPDASGA